MTADRWSYVLFAVAILAFASYLVRARKLGRDASRAGVTADAALRRQLRFHVVIGVLAFMGAALL